jgi:hypothetical protein
VLGEYRCGGSWCNALVRSRDAGKHFARVGLAALPSQGNVASLTFVGPRVGYLLGGSLYVTHDGGTIWRPWGPAGVTDIAVGGGDVYALVSRSRFERSPISTSSWHTVTLPARFRFLVSLAARGRTSGSSGRRATCVPVTSLFARLTGARGLRGVTGLASRSWRAASYPRPGWSRTADADQRRPDRRTFDPRGRSLPWCKRSTAPYLRWRPPLDSAAADRSVRTTRLVRLLDESRRGGAYGDTIPAESGLLLADDRRRHNLASRTDSLTARPPIGVKRAEEPPERGGVKRARRRMMLCVEHNLGEPRCGGGSRENPLKARWRPLLSAGPLPLWSSRDLRSRSLDKRTPRARECDLGRLRAVTVWDALDERPTSRARARQRPARAQSGLRLSPLREA